MYIYRYGTVSDAVHAKIENAKQSVMGGESKSFGEIIRAQMKKTESKTAVSSSEKISTSGSTILYALQNSDSDTTAQAVLETLGFTDSDEEGSSDTVSNAVSSYLSALSGDSSTTSASNLYSALLSGEDSTASLYSTLLSSLL